MCETEKLFVCTSDGCQEKFNNEDELNVHRKTHMVLDLCLTTKNIDNADQTPTPTRFIKNCEEVGLFQDLQNVNPFDETFKKAIQNGKSGSSYGPTTSADDTLHTPHIFPHIEAESNVQFNSHHEMENLTHDFMMNNVSSVENRIENRTNEQTVVTDINNDEDDESDANENLMKTDFVNVDKKLNSHDAEHFDIKQEVRNALKNKLSHEIKKDLHASKKQRLVVDKSLSEKNVSNKASHSKETPKLNHHKKKSYSEMSSTERRRALNRAAQLRSRARKKQRIKEMENEMEKLKADYKELNIKCETLKNENAALKTVLLKHENCSISHNPAIIQETQKILNAASFPPKILKITDGKEPKTTKNRPVLPVPKSIPCQPVLLTTIPTVDTTTVFKSVLENDKVYKLISLPVLPAGHTTTTTSSKST